MQGTRQHPLVKPLAVVTAAAVTATLIAVTSGQSASAVGPDHKTELAFKTPSAVSWQCGDTRPFATINTASYKQVRIVGRSIFGQDATFRLSLAEGSDAWEIGRMAVPGKTSQSTVIDVPGRSLVITVECAAGSFPQLTAMVFGN